MLAGEEAQAVLKGMADEKWLAKARRRARRLRRPLHKPALALLEPEPPSYKRDEYDKRQRVLDEVAGQLDEMSPVDLEALMSAFHPQLGPALAQWWIDAQSQPYGRGWLRRGFRAPNTPAMTRTKRLSDLICYINTAGPFAEDPAWFAGWAAFITAGDGLTRTAAFGPLLAAVIDRGGPDGEATYQVLIDSANGDHPVGQMGRHVIVALLRSSRADGWAYIESMLLAAQRQEGLRQSILEATDEAHPEAFTRIIDIVLEHNLIRFAATIRAVGVWLGFGEEVPEAGGQAEQHLRLLQQLRADPEMARSKALGGTPWECYLSLCSLAYVDVTDALEVAVQAASSPDPDRRAATVRFYRNTGLGDSLIPAYVVMLGDPDLGVAALVHEGIRMIGRESATNDLHRALDQLARRLPDKPTTTPPLGIETEPIALDRGAVAGTMIYLLGDRPPEPLLDFLPSLDSGSRAALVSVIGRRDVLDGDLRRAVVTLLGDRSSYVRECAVKAFGKLVVDDEEALRLEPLLTRKSADLRRGIIELLARQPVGSVVASAERLWAGKAPQRDAACELLVAASTLKHTDDRDRSRLTAAAANLADGNPSSTQRQFLDMLDQNTAAVTIDETLGLYRHEHRTPPRRPTKVGRGTFIDPASFTIAEALDDLAAANRNTPFEIWTWSGSKEMLLGDIHWLPDPFRNRPDNAENDNWGMVLPEVFRAWWQTTSYGAVDALRALASVQLCNETEIAPYYAARIAEMRKLLRPMTGRGSLQLRHPKVVAHVLQWLLVENADGAVMEECIDGAETAMALVPKKWNNALPGLDSSWQSQSKDWRGSFERCPWFQLTSGLYNHNPMLMAPEQIERWFGLWQWFDQPVPGARRQRIDHRLLYAAHAIGVASDADVFEHLIGSAEGWYGPRKLRDFTRRRRRNITEQHPLIVPLADQVRDRVIEIERARGELATPASHLVFLLSSVEGADLTLELLGRLGRASLVRGHLWNNQGRDASYSRLLQVSYPSPDDTPERVAELIAEHSANGAVSEKRLIELAMFAPQWAPTIEQVLGWDGLEDAVWWFHTHTKDDRWSVEVEVRETWAAMSGERTPLSAADLTDGAVDVGWFHRAYDRLGEDRWAQLQKSAKLASGGSGHRRAQIFADAMLGRLDETAARARIKEKRHQDTVRALGLLPLPSESAAAEATALDRYRALREFERGSKKFGQQRQASEGRAVAIAIENLARATGAADPQRFIWAMEAAEAGELADGPVSATVDDVTVSLGITAEGEPEILVRRGEKSLKAVPAKMRKLTEFKELTDQRTALRRQASRVRRSLEEAMVRQDPFVVDDFVALDRHLVVAPMLELLVFVDSGGTTWRRIGGKLVDHDGAVGGSAGKRARRGRSESLRIAHPSDLLADSNWIAWQEQLFDDHQRQPFKQAFRELYVLTEAEMSDSPRSRRWTGHQLQSRQAHGLFTARGWLSDWETAEVAKVYHHADLVARVEFVDGWGTPAEVELPTIDSLYFTARNSGEMVPLSSIPPVVFSETMRDLDLVASVAHAGGVDPEATASTIEMRAALVTQTVRLMNLDNVTIESSHAVIEGSLGEYSLHLGSGTVHRRPGGALCIIPVDAQRRGRVFLPFADNDPKTAEVVSKVLLLARDKTIKDPTILEQLRS